MLHNYRVSLPFGSSELYARILGTTENGASGEEFTDLDRNSSLQLSHFLLKDRRIVLFDELQQGSLSYIFMSVRNFLSINVVL